MQKEFNHTKILLSILLAVILIVGTPTAQIHVEAVSKNYVKSLTISPKKGTIVIPANKKTAVKNFKVKVKVKGKKINKNVIVKSSNKKVATVKYIAKGSKIKVTGKKPGKAIITVTTKGKTIKKKRIKKKFTVIVKKNSANNNTQKKPDNTQDTSKNTQSQDTVKYYTVLFNSNGGSSISSQKIKAGQTVTKPQNPTREGYEFQGWYKNSTLTSSYSFSSSVNSNFTLYAKWKAIVAPEEKSLGVLSSETTAVKTNTFEEVLFTLNVSKGVNPPELIDLYSDTVHVAYMRDDGTNGDEIANDKIYTAKVPFHETKETEDIFQAVAGTLKSTTITFRYFNEIDDSDINNYQEDIKIIQDIEDDYETNGTVDDSKEQAAINAVYSQATEWKKEGKVLSTTKEEHGVTMQFSSGIWYVYQPERDDVDAVGSDVNVSIFSLQPFKTWYEQNRDVETALLDIEGTDEAAEKIAKKFPNYTFEKNCDNKSVSLDVVNNFSSNQVILWHGHGGFTSNFGPYIITGESLNSGSFSQNLLSYTADLLSGRLVLTGYDQLAITGGYVQKHIHNMNNSFIYLAACETGRDARLARSFLDKGASAVIANDESIVTKYNSKMMIEVVNGLLMVNNSENNYYTLKQALYYAKSKNGNNDGSTNHAKAILFGDENYRLAEMNSEDNPYVINSASELYAIRNDLSGHYALGGDIDLRTWENWTPIGDIEETFKGTFDGRGHRIIGLNIDNTKYTGIGLFGYCDYYAKIRNVDLESIDIELNNNLDVSSEQQLCVGGIAGYALTIENCSVSGSIIVNNNTNRNLYVGGIVGHGRSIKNSTNYSKISVNNNIKNNMNNANEYNCGGIVGCGSNAGYIIDCNNHGNIKTIGNNSFNKSGGISGVDGKIFRCCNYGDVYGKTLLNDYIGYSGNCNVGGIVGNTSGEVIYSVNNGKIESYALKGGSSYAGGIAGWNGFYGSGVIRNCINMGQSIKSTRQEKSNDIYSDVKGEAGRVAAVSYTTSDSYSLPNALCNGTIPTEFISSSEINGANISSTEAETMISSWKEE